MPKLTVGQENSADIELHYETTAPAGLSSSSTAGR